MDTEIINQSEILGKQINVYGNIETPLFLAKDVAGWLEHSDAHKMVESVDDDEKVRNIVPTLGGNQEAWFLTENGLYEVFMLSRKPIAKQLKKGIKEMLHSVRLHGAYMTEDTIKKALTSPDFLIQLATNLKEEQERSRLLKAQADAQQQQLQLQAPKVLFANAVETSKKSCLIGELAKIIKQNGTEIGQNRLFEWMRINGYLCKYGESRNQPTQKAMELNLFEIKKITITNPDGSVRVTTTTKVTPKGQIYFINRFLGKSIESEMQSVGNNSAHQC